MPFRRLARLFSAVSAAWLALALPPGGHALAPNPAARSGVYESLTLTVSGIQVFGVFAEARGPEGPGGAPQFACIFLLRGALEGSRATFESWFPSEAERISGTLDFSAEDASLTLAENHGGCLNTTGTMVGEPYRLSRSTDVRAEGWVGVGLVTARRAELRREPGPAQKRAPYLVENDPVVILERKDGWVRALYIGAKSPTFGWLAADDLSVVAP